MTHTYFVANGVLYGDAVKADEGLSRPDHWCVTGAFTRDDG
jgi:hypothetical protein